MDNDNSALLGFPQFVFWAVLLVPCLFVLAYIARRHLGPSGGRWRLFPLLSGLLTVPIGLAVALAGMAYIDQVLPGFDSIEPSLGWAALVAAIVVVVNIFALLIVRKSPQNVLLYPLAGALNILSIAVPGLYLAFYVYSFMGSWLAIHVN
jgi:hypothetical protein